MVGYAIMEARRVEGDLTLNGLRPRARTVLRNALDGPVNAEAIARLTRAHLLATPGCGLLIADEIIRWARGQGIAISDGKTD